LALGFLAVPFAGAYVNAGFRSQGDYDRYLRYEKQVSTKIAPFSAAIHRNPDDAIGYYQRARAWDQLPVYIVHGDVQAVPARHWELELELSHEGEEPGPGREDPLDQVATGKPGGPAVLVHQVKA
jgi:hypothetical protein